MAQQQHRGPEARKVELERRLDENEKTVSRGLSSNDDGPEQDQSARQQQQSGGGQGHKAQQAAPHRSGRPSGGNIRQDREE